MDLKVLYTNVPLNPCIASVANRSKGHGVIILTDLLMEGSP